MLTDPRLTMKTADTANTTTKSKNTIPPYKYKSQVIPFGVHQSDIAPTSIINRPTTINGTKIVVLDAN